MEKRKVLSIQEVTLTNATFYEIIKSEIQEKITGEKEKRNQQYLLLPLTYTEFCDLFISFGTYYLYRQNQEKGFVIDPQNEPVIEQLFFYLTKNTSFNGELSKGIMLQGKFGCGKTVILGTYSLIHNHLV